MGNIHQSKRTVIKIGSSSLTHENGLINIRAMESIVKVLSDIVNSGREIIIVTSGAVAVGMGVMGIKKRPDDIPSRQAVAAIGQCELMSLYQDMFGKYHHIVSQILLSRDVTDNAQFTQNVRNTFDKLLEMNVIPIVNENDSICVDELAYGDNDTLSAIVAVISDSDSLVLLTDTDGLYTANPKKDKTARLIRQVGVIDETITRPAGESDSAVGTGGMKTKLLAASYAQEHDINTYIISGEDARTLYDLFDGKEVGTHFLKRSEL